MNHADKVREKNEINQMIEILKDHSSSNFWQASLRKTTEVDKRRSLKSRESKLLESLMNMEKNTMHLQVGSRNDKG